MLLFYINSILMFYPKICFRKQVFLNAITTSPNVQVSKVYKYFCTTLPNSGEVEVTRKCSGGWMLERSTIWGEQNPLWL